MNLLAPDAVSYFPVVEDGLMLSLPSLWAASKYDLTQVQHCCAQRNAVASQHFV